MKKQRDKQQVRLTQLVDARIHLGHRNSRWNPKMASYLYGIREGVHIIDVRKTAILLGKALGIVANILKKGGNILVVGNRRENTLLTAALGKTLPKRIGFINTKWMGGTLTNWETFDASQKAFANSNKPYKRNRLRTYLRGLPKDFGLPSLIVVLNTNSNTMLISEANTLHIPVVGVVDTNSDPVGVAYPIPGNDDSASAHFFYCQALSYAILKGLQGRSYN